MLRCALYTGYTNAIPTLSPHPVSSRSAPTPLRCATEKTSKKLPDGLHRAQPWYWDGGALAHIVSVGSKSPSPNQGRFTINCTAGNARIDIFNTMGQLVFTGQLKEGNNSIDLSHLNSGMYFAMVSGNEIINQKTTIIITE